MALMFGPVLALFFGWLQLHEQITINIILGALLICCGIFMNTFTFSRRKV
jgi:drug/metabolite transporter (DMT)-like permease